MRRVEWQFFFQNQFTQNQKIVRNWMVKHISMFGKVFFNWQYLPSCYFLAKFLSQSVKYFLLTFLFVNLSRKICHALIADCQHFSVCALVVCDWSSFFSTLWFFGMESNIINKFGAGTIDSQSTTTTRRNVKMYSKHFW